MAANAARATTAVRAHASPLARWLQAQWWQPRPTLAAHALRPFATLYGTLAQHNRRQVRPERIDAPVIVVGNLVVGGAGKTPTTIALVEALRARGFTPGVVSRGYGRHQNDVRWVDPEGDEATSVGDEPLLIARRTRAPVVVGRDRLAAARRLRSQRPTVDVVIADDGLQHARLARDAQLIVIDERGFGNGLLLPAGPLREVPGDAPPPRSVVLYNAATPSTRWPGATASRALAGVVPLCAWRAGAAAERADLDALMRRPVVAAAGIAVPERFFAMLERAGLTIERVPLPDHHDWSHAPPLHLADDRVLVVTEKDAVKIAPDAPDTARTWVAPLDFAIPSDVVDALVAWLPHADVANAGGTA